MKRIPRPSRRIPRPLSWLILAAVALFLAISLSILLLSLHSEQTRQKKEFREDIVWFTSQVEREAMV